MTRDEYDTLLDDAAHSVNKLIPKMDIDALLFERHIEMLGRLNDAIHEVLFDYIEVEDE